MVSNERAVPEHESAATTERVVLSAARRKTTGGKTTAKKSAVKTKAATKKAGKKKTVAKKAVKKKAAATKRAVTKNVVKKKAATRTTPKTAGPKKKTASRKTAVTKKKSASGKRTATERKHPSSHAPEPAVEETVAPAAVHEPATPPVPDEAAPKQRPTRRRTGRRQAREATPAATQPAFEARPSTPSVPDDEEIVPFEDDGTPALDRVAPPDASPHEVLEGVRKGRLHVSALGALRDEEIAALARDAGMSPRPRERRSDLLVRLLQDGSTRETVKSTFVEGLLEMHPDGYGFLRRPERNYSQHPEDVYVSAGLIRKLGLKPGHWISGTARPSRPGEPLLALHHVEDVNHEDVEGICDLTPFENLTVVYPDQRFLLEVNPDDYEMRVMDLFCPLGQGQRALIVSPPRAGKTVILQKLADAIAHNSPYVDIVVLLVDERPEEVTNMRRSVRGEVIASTFDKPASNHVRIAELVMERVKRMVELGRHVVLLLDSITRLGRAYNNTSGSSGRILTGGLEAKALTRPKRFFGAARNIEDGGSLTIVATALVDTGSRMDDVIFEEFKGSGNMEVVLDRDLANARVWPAINLPASGTRNEDLLLHPEELRRINVLRKAMAGRDPQSVMEGMREQLDQYRTNAELLMSLQ